MSADTGQTFYKTQVYTGTKFSGSGILEIIGTNIIDLSLCCFIQEHGRAAELRSSVALVEDRGCCDLPTVKLSETNLWFRAL